MNHATPQNCRTIFDAGADRSAQLKLWLAPMTSRQQQAGNIFARKSKHQQTAPDSTCRANLVSPTICLALSGSTNSEVINTCGFGVTALGEAAGDQAKIGPGLFDGGFPA